MKHYITLLLIALLVPAFSFAQEEEEYNYTSQEEEAYYRDRHYTPFKPVKKKVVANYCDDFFKFVEVDDYAPYNDTLYFTPYQDSIFHVDLERGWSGSLIVDYVGKVDKYFILKHEKKGNVEALVYKDGEFENRYFGEMGIWVAYSEDNGETWSYYYTGIVQKQPLYVKWYSSYPLINEQGDLQIEACLLRQTSPFTHPGPGPSYQLVKDGLLLTLDLETLRKDSDGDGLTDIVEAKFRTDPNNADTDGDGVPDNLDMNPRFAPQRTEKTSVFEAIIDNEGLCRRWDDEDCEVLFTKMPESHFVDDNTATVLIVTDDTSLQSIQPKSYRVIILSTEEYENESRCFKNDLDVMRITPLFKVDGEDDTYVVSQSIGTGGAQYMVKKTPKGWKIVAISFWIS